MSTHEFPLPLPSDRTVLAGPRKTDAAADYRAKGRIQVRVYLAKLVSGLDPLPACDLLLDHRLPRKVVRFWALEDLFPTPQFELAARAGYPELARVFRGLDAERRVVRERQILDNLGRSIEEILGS